MAIKTTPFEKIIDAVAGERLYQTLRWGHANAGDKLLAERPRTVAEYLTFMRAYMNMADHAQSTQSGDQQSLDIIRKIVALGIACMEHNGVVPRDLSRPVTNGHNGKLYTPSEYRPLDPTVFGLKGSKTKHRKSDAAGPQLCAACSTKGATPAPEPVRTTEMSNDTKTENTPMEAAAPAAVDHAAPNSGQPKSKPPLVGLLEALLLNGPMAPGAGPGKSNPKTQFGRALAEKLREDIRTEARLEAQKDTPAWVAENFIEAHIVAAVRQWYCDGMDVNQNLLDALNSVAALGFLAARQGETRVIRLADYRELVLADEVGHTTPFGSAQFSLDLYAAQRRGHLPVLAEGDELGDAPFPVEHLGDPVTRILWATYYGARDVGSVILSPKDSLNAAIGAINKIGAAEGDYMFASEPLVTAELREGVLRLKVTSFAGVRTTKHRR